MAVWSFDDTIAAIATARGQSAIAVVRVSGPAARSVLLSVAPELAFRPLAPRRQTLVDVRDPLSSDNMDHALITWFPGPSSYTGEDTFEISTHGGPLVPRLVLDAVIAAGAREALPGEFTRRALLNGKLDLLEAEAVLDLIAGSSPALHRNAIHQLEGGLSTRIAEIRGKLIELTALVAYGIDFPDEDEPPVPISRIARTAEEALERMERLLATAPHGQLLQQGALVVLAGRPNSGKSSLFNALCGQERALVTEIPGTTRDAIEIAVPIEGFPFRLVDTAGIRATEDVVESLGIEVARRYVSGADIVLFCAEAGRELDDAETSFVQSLAAPALIVRTKSDLNHAEAGANEVRVSARSGEGLDVLREKLLALAFTGQGVSSDEPIVTRERHVRSLTAAAEEVRLFVQLYTGDTPPEVAAVHLAGALDHLEELVGRIDQEDVLDAVFSQFCVGK